MIMACPGYIHLQTECFPYFSLTSSGSQHAAHELDQLKTRCCFYAMILMLVRYENNVDIAN